MEEDEIVDYLAEKYNINNRINKDSRSKEKGSGYKKVDDRYVIKNEENTAMK